MASERLEPYLPGSEGQKPKVGSLSMELNTLQLLSAHALPRRDRSTRNFFVQTKLLQLNMECFYIKYESGEQVLGSRFLKPLEVF